MQLIYNFPGYSSILTCKAAKVFSNSLLGMAALDLQG